MDIIPITKPVHRPLHMDVFYLGFNYHRLKSALQPAPGGRRRARANMRERDREWEVGFWAIVVRS